MTELSFNSSLNTFTQALTQKGKSTNTIVAYKGDLNQLITFLKKQDSSLNIETVTENSIESFKKDLTQVPDPTTRCSSKMKKASLM